MIFLVNAFPTSYIIENCSDAVIFVLEISDVQKRFEEKTVPPATACCFSFVDC